MPVFSRRTDDDNEDIIRRAMSFVGLKISRWDHKLKCIIQKAFFVYIVYRLYVTICQSKMMQLSLPSPLRNSKLLHQKSVCVIRPIGSSGCSKCSIMARVFGRMLANAANSFSWPVMCSRNLDNCGSPCSTNC